MKNIMYKKASNEERVEFKMGGKVQIVQNQASKLELIQQQKRRKAQNFEAIKNNFKNILKKNECNDIFKDICKNKTLIYEQKDYSKFLKSKIKAQSCKGTQSKQNHSSKHRSRTFRRWVQCIWSIHSRTTAYRFSAALIR